MRAAVFKEGGKPWVLETVADPTPGPGEAVIKVCRCGICGSDVHMTSGHGMDYAPGTIPGHEFAGEVVAVAGDVTSLKIGDRVTAMPATGCGNCVACLSGYPLGCNSMQGMVGGFGEYMRVSANASVRLPASLSMTDGALVEPLAVGLHGVKLAGPLANARVLVIGSGAIGLSAIYWARRLGAGRIVAASPSTRRRDLAMSMGADAFETLGEDASARINSALGGMPEVVLECAGAPGVLAQSVELAGPGATIVSLGFCTSPDPVIPAMATFKRVTIRFSFAYGLSEFQHAADCLDRGWVEPRVMVTGLIGLNALPDMIEAMRHGKAGSATKVHVDPWG